MSYGMTWYEFWHSSLDRLHDYWQKNQFEVEQRNREMWLQGAYIRMAVMSSFDKTCKYPAEPARITEMTEAEKEAENKRKVEQMREQLMQIKARWDERHNGVDAG